MGKDMHTLRRENVVVAFSNCVLGDLKCLAAALYSYSPNLEEMAQCSMITPLTF